VDNPQFFKELVTIWKREIIYTPFQEPNFIMTKIDVGLMGVCSNSHEHENYENK